MDIQDLVRQHYGGGDLTGGILAALAAAGRDTAALTVRDLAAVDSCTQVGRRRPGTCSSGLS